MYHNLADTNRVLGFGRTLDLFLNFFARGSGATYDKDRILAAQRADHFGPPGVIDRFGDWLGASCDRLYHDQLANALE